MPLFKRKSKSDEGIEQAVEVETWTKRVARVGFALDSLHDESRDVVIITEGDAGDRGEVVSLLGYRQSTFIAGWTSLMYRLMPEREAVQFIDERGMAPKLALAPRNVWQKQLRGVGLLMDALPAELQSPTIVILPSGVVINALAGIEIEENQLSLRSYAFSNEQIAEALLRDLPAVDGAHRPIAR